MSGGPQSYPPPVAPPPMWSPMHQPRMDPWPMLALWGRVGGFLLIFVGSLVAVAFATPGGGCVQDPTTCPAATHAGWQNAVLAAKVLWTIGLFGLGAGAGIKLHWGLRPSAGTSATDMQFITADRRLNGLLVVVSTVLLLVLLLSVGIPMLA